MFCFGSKPNEVEYSTSWSLADEWWQSGMRNGLIDCDFVHSNKGFAPVCHGDKGLRHNGSVVIAIGKFYCFLPTYQKHACNVTWLI